jgi:hypothetical protein
MLRAVLDTNVLVSAFLFHERRGVPVVILHRAAEGRFSLVSSSLILDEVEDVLVRDPAVCLRYGYTPEAASAYRRLLKDLSELVEPQPPFPRVSRDPDDDMIVATAVLAKADYLATGDHDLRTLGEHSGVHIVTPRQFLDTLSA